MDPHDEESLETIREGMQELLTHSELLKDALVKLGDPEQLLIRIGDLESQLRVIRSILREKGIAEPGQADILDALDSSSN